MLSNYEPDARMLGWGLSPQEGIDEMALHRGRHIILDVGANTLASKREIVGAIHAMIWEANRTGYRCIAFLPVTPNKRGATEMLLKLAETLPPVEKIIVQNDVDHSGNFEKVEGEHLVVRLTHLDPGLMECVDVLSNGCFAESIIVPPTDRKLASRLLTRWLLDFVNLLPSDQVFTNAAKLLERFEPMRRLNVRILRASAATDDALKGTAHRSKVVDLHNSHGWDSNGIERTAHELRKSE
jgi:hypothetical protein